MTSTGRRSEPVRRSAPLSLYHLLDPEVLANPYPLYRRLRDARIPCTGTRTCTPGSSRATTTSAPSSGGSPPTAPRPRSTSRPSGCRRSGPIARMMVKQMLFLDAPAHTRLRRLAGAGVPAGAGRHAAASTSRTSPTGLIDDVLARGDGPDGPDGRLRRAAAGDGHHRAARRAGRGPRQAQGVVGHVRRDARQLPAQPGPARRRAGTAVENLTELLPRRDPPSSATHPRDGLVGAFLAAEVDGDRLTDEEVAANCIVTMVGGLETTTNLIGNGMLTLLRNPADLERLRAEPELMPSAVEELLRYESPSQHTARIARDDLELGGKQIRKGQAVIAVMAAGNRDPERFPRPRPAGPRPARQPASGVRLGRRTSASARRWRGWRRRSPSGRCCPPPGPPAHRGTAGLAGEPRAAGAHVPAADLHGP